jgi:hypothetical protein
VRVAVGFVGGGHRVRSKIVVDARVVACTGLGVGVATGIAFLFALRHVWQSDHAAK